MTTQILFNIDSMLKKKVAARAKREGVSLSDVFKFAAKAYADESINFGLIERPEIPNTRTAKRWAKIDQDITEDRNVSPLFDSAEDAIAYLKKEVAHYRKKRA